MRDGKENGPDNVNGVAGPRDQQQRYQQQRVDDASRPKGVTPSFSDAALMANAGYELIPLKSGSKAPRDTNWTRRRYDSNAVIAEARRQSGNLGVRLRAVDLVIDVDPRNGGSESLARLVASMGLDPDAWPHVTTGGGGHHYYLRKPAELATVGKLDAFPGIDFKKLGGQVVAPGSVHPETRRPYVALFFLVSPHEAPVAPEPLLDLLQVRRVAAPDGIADADRWGEIDPGQLAAALEAVPADDFGEGTHDEWFQFMCACHHATAGAGREEFIEWSTQAPGYGDDAEKIGARWDSLSSAASRGGRPTTIRHLYQVLARYGGGVPHPPPEQDFDEWEDPADLGAGVDDSALREPPKPMGIAAVIEEMNARHYVALDGGFQVVTEEPDPIFDGRVRYQRLSKSDFRSLYENQLVEKADKLVTKAELWLKSPERRTYKGIIFDPAREHAGWLNMWKGWSVEPRRGDWSLLDSLIREVLTDGDAASYEYVLNWIAFMFQHPERVAEVALAFRGAKGTGKGTLGRALFKLAGASGLHISSPGHLVGRFNSHLQNCVCLFADEAFWAGDKAGESVLKQLVTEPTLTYEGKGRDAVTGRNHVHIVMASNNDWVVPAGMDGERRFAVFNVNNRRRGDHDFFRELNRQLSDGGLAGLLHDMLARDIGDWHPREGVPQTEALAEQKAMSMSAEESWWDGILDSGRLPSFMGSLPWHEESVEVDPDEIHMDYAEHARRIGARPRDKKGLAMRIRKRAGIGRRQVLLDDGRRTWRWVLPRLDDARAKWEACD